MLYVKDEVVWQLGWRRVVEERPDKSLGLAASDHSTAARRDWHRTCSSQQFQLHRSALDTRDAERHATVVDLVVTIQQHIPNANANTNAICPSLTPQ